MGEVYAYIHIKEREGGKEGERGREEEEVGILTHTHTHTRTRFGRVQPRVQPQQARRAVLGLNACQRCACLWPSAGMGIIVKGLVRVSAAHREHMHIHTCIHMGHTCPDAPTDTPPKR